MKDLKYFLEEENKYCKMERGVKSSPLDFLRTCPFRQTIEQSLEYIKDNTKGYDLSEVEMVVLGLFIMHHSKYFRDDYYGKEIPDIAKNMFEVLNNVVSKAPKIECDILYRFCHSHDEFRMKDGDVLYVSHNLTCTQNIWPSHRENRYIIKPLPQDKTRAHAICKMYHHNEKEAQVNYLRGTRFHVTKVEEIVGTEYHLFYMDELK